MEERQIQLREMEVIYDTLEQEIGEGSVFEYRQINMLRIMDKFRISKKQMDIFLLMICARRLTAILWETNFTESVNNGLPEE